MRWRAALASTLRNRALAKGETALAKRDNPFILGWLGRVAWRCVVASLLAAAALPAAAFAQALADGPAELCRAQADAIEHAMSLPPGLLLAIGRVESGRADASHSDVLPWPWSVNDEGADHVFASAFDAIAYVVAARGRGSRSLDVGCFQVNLQFHPDAFATVADAFDPAANARYAGQLLADLHARSGSWETAVRLYHSATPWRGEAYRDLVLSRWAETSLAATAAPTLPRPLAVPPALASASRPPGAGEEAIRRGGRVARVRVETPFSASPPVVARTRLPRVIVPTATVAPPGVPAAIVVGSNGAH
jgi:hypothetical protein